MTAGGQAHRIPFDCREAEARICIFAGFLLGSVTDLAVFGFGLAVAVLIDATLVRMVLVPRRPGGMNAQDGYEESPDGPRSAQWPGE